MSNPDNFEGRLTLTAPTGGVTAGSMYSIQALVCLALATVSAGEQFAAQVSGRVSEAPAEGASGQAWTAGQALYWDDSESRFTVTSTGNNHVAYAAADKSATATVGDVWLMNGLASIS